MVSNDAPKPKLLDRLRTEIRLRHYSPRPGEAYAGWTRRYVLFHGKRHPAEMGEAEIGRFLTHLAEELGVSAATQNQALNALVFLYRQVLRLPVGDLAPFVRALLQEMKGVPRSRTPETGLLRTTRCCKVRRSSGLNAYYPGHPGTVPHLLL